MGNWFGGGGGGGGGPSESTVTQTNIPEWLRPQTETMLGAAMEELFDIAPDGTVVGTKPYTPYSTNINDYFAGFSPMEQQAQANAMNLQMPGQYLMGTDLASTTGMMGLQSSNNAAFYGDQGFQIGQSALGLVPTSLGYGQLGQNVANRAMTYGDQAAGIGDWYEGRVTDPAQFSRYMSPYMDTVVDQQLQSARRQDDISAQQRASAAAKAGAFGGSRLAIENAEANRALASQMDSIVAQGKQKAYESALGNINNQAGLTLQGLGQATSGLGTALQGGQLGLQGIGTANQLIGTGIEGARTGIAGEQQQLEGLNLANQSAQILGTLGDQQLGAQMGILGLQREFGSDQRAMEQAKIDQAVLNFANQQQAPLQAINDFNAILRGYAQPGQTVTKYQAEASPMTQLAGLGTALSGAKAANLFKQGGQVKQKGNGIADIAVQRALKGK